MNNLQIDDPDLTASDIAYCLQNVDSDLTHDIPGQWTHKGCTDAAVLIPFQKIEKQWHLLFIRRSEHELDHHSGQVAFAGGKSESDDSDLQQTALREAEEEIGLSPTDVTILGELNHHYSITRFRIKPVIAHIPWPYSFSPDPQEVARVFTIPIDWLADPGNHRVEFHELSGRKKIPVVYFNEYDGEVLWGATARMTLSLLSLLQKHKS